jgi:hypothetical protein
LLLSWQKEAKAPGAIRAFGRYAVRLAFKAQAEAVVHARRYKNRARLEIKVALNL